ncbi:unnamed protein product [Calypogeia fissa]
MNQQDGDDESILTPKWQIILPEEVESMLARSGFRAMDFHVEHQDNRPPLESQLNEFQMIVLGNENAEAILPSDERTTVEEDTVTIVTKTDSVMSESPKDVAESISGTYLAAATAQLEKVVPSVSPIRLQTVEERHPNSASSGLVNRSNPAAIQSGGLLGNVSTKFLNRGLHDVANEDVDRGRKSDN